MSDTDAEAYIAVELGTNANEQARKHGKVTLDLVIGLQHKRSAMRRDAAIAGGYRFGSWAARDP